MKSIRSKEADEQQRARATREVLVIKRPPTPRDPEDLVPCRRHPDWRPSAATHGPRPPQNSDGTSPLCPYCLEVAEARGGREKKPRPMVDAVVVDLNRASPRDEALWEAKLEERAAEGHVNPGTSEEEHALARIDELRQEDTAGRIAGAHPDLGGDFHFRKGVSDREIKRRRSAARRHWKRYAKNAVA